MYYQYVRDNKLRINILPSDLLLPANPETESAFEGVLVHAIRDE